MDGGLESTMYDAQAQLADAYLAAGQGAEARAIAEDLVAREPWEGGAYRPLPPRAGDAAGAGARHGHRRTPERTDAICRDAIIFPSPRPLDAPPRRRQPAAGSSAVAPPSKQPSNLSHGLRPRSQSAPASRRHPRRKRADARNRSVRARWATSMTRTTRALRRRRGVSTTSSRGLRKDAARGEAADQSAQHMKLARTYLEMGMLEEATRSLKTAARSPRQRFEAASMLGRLYKEHGDLAHAIEWFEQRRRSAGAGAEDGRALLYDLGVALEDAGETTRALSVFLELQAEAASTATWRDRADRLARVQTGG